MQSDLPDHTLSSFFYHPVKIILFGLDIQSLPYSIMSQRKMTYRELAESLFSAMDAINAQQREIDSLKRANESLHRKLEYYENPDFLSLVDSLDWRRQNR